MSDLIPQHALPPGDGLIVVEVEIDFCPGGAPAIKRAHEVVPVLNRWIAAVADADVPVSAASPS